MALLIDDIELAWRSLRDSADASGWRSISIATIGRKPARLTVKGVGPLATPAICRRPERKASTCAA